MDIKKKPVVKKLSKEENKKDIKKLMTDCRDALKYLEKEENYK